MITLRMKQSIIKLYLEGVSERGIERKTGHSRNTVRKYIKQYEQSRHADVRDLPVAEDILKKPTYKKRKGRKKVLTDDIKQELKTYIKENIWKREHYMAKQQMKVIDMHERLLSKGYTISYTTVRNFVNQEISKTKEVYIRRHCTPGYEVEFDWGEIKLDIDHKLKTYYLAIFTFPFSNYRFARIYESQSMVCVLDVHVDFIKHIGFVPDVFTYDNMRTVVKEFIGRERTITDSMTHLSDYYQFKIRLCQPRRGNEKGHVERSVEFIRRKAFSSTYTFGSLEEAGDHLVETLEQLNNRPHHEHKIAHKVLLNQESAVSNPDMSPFDVSDLIEARVDKYSTITFKQNHYSVPEGYVGHYIKVKVGAKEIKLFIEGELVAVHRRNWGLHQWVMDINHYLKTFERKKGALAQSECLRQAPTEIKNIYKTHYIGKEKEFLELLFYIKEHGNIKGVLNAIKQLEEIRSGYVSTEKVLFICEQSGSTNHLAPKDDDIAKQSESNLKAYAALFNQLEGASQS